MLIDAPHRAAEPEKRTRHRWRGQRGRHPDVTPREGLDPDREQRDGHDRHENDRWPVVLAGQRDVVRGPAPPRQVGEGRQLGHRGLVAVEDEPGERDRAGDARGGATPDERAEGEGDRAGGECQQAEPDRVGERGEHADLVAGQDGERAAGDGDRDEHDEHDEAERQDVARELLDRDAPARSAGRGHELQAAALRLAGERSGQGEDRPQAQHEREEDAVLVLEVPAERVDVDDLAGHPLKDGRHGVDEVLELFPRLRRVELGGDGPAHAEEEQRQQDPGDDRRPPRVADRSWRRCCRGRRCGSRPMGWSGPPGVAVVIGSPPRPCPCRTRPGRSPRATARG